MIEFTGERVIPVRVETCRDNYEIRSKVSSHLFECGFEGAPLIGRRRHSAHRHIEGVAAAAALPRLGA